MTNDTDVDDANATSPSSRLDRRHQRHGRPPGRRSDDPVHPGPQQEQGHGRLHLTYRVTDGSLTSTHGHPHDHGHRRQRRPGRGQRHGHHQRGHRVSGNVLTNDTDVDDDTPDGIDPGSSIVGTNGTLVLEGRRIYTYGPTPPRRARHGHRYRTPSPTPPPTAAASDTATLTVTVTGVNDAPVAVNDTATTNEDTAVDKDVVTNDTDVDDANANLTVVDELIVATNGTAVLLADDRTIRFTPDLNKQPGQHGRQLHRDLQGHRRRPDLDQHGHPHDHGHRGQRRPGRGQRHGHHQRGHRGRQGTSLTNDTDVDDANASPSSQSSIVATNGTAVPYADASDTGSPRSSRRTGTGRLHCLQGHRRHSPRPHGHPHDHGHRASTTPRSRSTTPPPPTRTPRSTRTSSTTTPTSTTPTPTYRRRELDRRHQRHGRPPGRRDDPVHPGPQRTVATRPPSPSPTGSPTAA